MRFLGPVAALLIAAALLGGCGSSSHGTTSSPSSHNESTAPPGASVTSCRPGKSKVTELKVTGTTCTEGRHLMLGWLVSEACRPPVAASRSSCPAHSYRCLATATNRGWSVNCAKPGSSIDFSIRRSGPGRQSSETATEPQAEAA